MLVWKINFIYWDLEKIPRDFNVMLISILMSLWRNYWRVETFLVNFTNKFASSKFFIALYERLQAHTKEQKTIKVYTTCDKWGEMAFKVAEDDIAFKLAILKKSLHLNDNTCFCSIIQSSKLVLGSLLAKNNLFCPILNKKFCILPDGQLWEWLTGGVALPQSKCNWSVGFAIARWPVGKASDNARIMLSSLIRYSLV